MVWVYVIIGLFAISLLWICLLLMSILNALEGIELRLSQWTGK